MLRPHPCSKHVLPRAWDQLDGATLKVGLSDPPSSARILFTSPTRAMDVAMVGEGEETHVLIHARSFSVTYEFMVSITVSFPASWQEARCLRASEVRRVR